MSAGKEFQTDGAATEKARRASSVRVRGTASSGAPDERPMYAKNVRQTDRRQTASSLNAPPIGGGGIIIGHVHSLCKSCLQ